MTLKPLSSFALKALSSAEISGQTLRVTQQLDRDLYVEVAKALDALGGKWSKKLRAHVFDGKTQDDITDALEQVLLSGGFTNKKQELVTNKKQELGQFFTPAALADKLVEYADVRPGMSVLEPSAGSGALCKAILESGSGQVKLTAFEIDDGAFSHLKLLRTGSFQMARQDFLSVSPDVSFDRVIMNPPFARGADVAHVMHAWKFLKPGGRLVSIMSAGPTFRQDRASAEFRLFVKRNTVAELTGRDGFIYLPAGSFSAAGTGVNTVVVVLERKAT